MYASCYKVRGESPHSLSLIRSSPRYVAGTPKGVLFNDRPLHVKICRTFFVGLHKTGPCMRQTWLYVIVSMRNLNLYSVIFLISHEVGRRIML